MQTNEAISKRLATVGIVGNIALSAMKLLAGIVGGSSAMISDAVHSLSDVLATAIAYVGVRVAARAADKGHPYGHERFECLASLALALILAVAGAGIGYAGVSTLINLIAAGGDAAAAGISADAPLYLAAGAAVISILAKEAMYRYTKHWATVMQSTAFLADAKHHRSDAFSSIGALVGIAASMAGFAAGDALASVVICLFILKMAWDVAVDAVDRMMDASCPEETEAAIRACVLAQPGVQRIDLLQTRLFGARAYVDLEIAVDGTLPLVEAHAIAEAAHNSVEAQFPQVKHIMIHVNPA